MWSEGEPMRLDKLDLNLFVVFDALYREGVVTKVALQLNITQPAVSNALNRLRKTFDDPLFVRTPAGMKPTPVADAVIADVRAALALLNKTMDSNVKFDPAQSEKTFTLGMNDMVQAMLLPKLQQWLVKAAPGVSLNSYYLPREQATEQLKAGVMDLLIDVPLVNAKELQQSTLLMVEHVIAMRKEHPLARKKMSLDNYLAAEHVHVSGRKRGRGLVDVALHSQGYRRNIAMRLENYLVAAQVASQTDLLWAAPAPLAVQFGLSKKALPIVVEPLDLRLYWAKSAANDPANEWLRQQLQKLAVKI
ncbi:MAG: DNA-binding transcriptional LysR family regulator [Oceanicoccus sp.]|jgi:DNA-binding transcriptional LysR family regulator